MASTKENLKREGINIGGDLNVYGDFIAPGAKKEVTFTGGKHYHGVPAPSQEPAEGEPAEDDTPNPSGGEDESPDKMPPSEMEPDGPLATDSSCLMKDLLPVFYGNEKEAEKFLAGISNMQPCEITRLVNDLVRKGVISQNWCKGDLWKILHAHGLYPRERRTWNKQVLG